jgi:hypothetical protein
MSAKMLRINARLEAGLARRVSAAQARTGKSLTDIVKESLDSYCDRLEAETTPLAALEAAGFVGSGSGARDLSSSYKQALSRSLARKLR